MKVEKEISLNVAKKQYDLITQQPIPSVPLPMDLLTSAVANGNIELAEKLMGLHERWEKNQARRAFDNAMAAVKSELPVIIKNRDVSFGAGKTSYKYEDLADIARVVDPILTKHGLSYRYRTTASDKDTIIVTCIVSHRDGHSEENSLPGPLDLSGSKNAIQAIGSTQTYLQRYTLKAALGLAASKDDDAQAATKNAPETIMQDQIKSLEDLVKDVGGERADLLRTNTLAKFNVASFAEVKTTDYARIFKAIEKKRKAST